MKYCTKCGAVCSDDTVFCGECGTPFPETDTTQNYNQENIPPNNFGNSYSYNMQGQTNDSYSYNNMPGQTGNSYSYNNTQGQTGGYGNNASFQPPRPYIAPRSIVMCIILSIITCGIYSIYWMIKMNDEINMLAGDTQAPSGGMVFLLSIITCGIYSFYWLYKMGEKCDWLKRINGNSNILFLLLALFGFSIVCYCLIQDTINKIV